MCKCTSLYVCICVCVSMRAYVHKRSKVSSSIVLYLSI